ncbi:MULTISPECIES: phosphopantetheine-binding protein [Bacillaceae]|uniref:Acyl carrier protein n=1 Tax=Evansella alkalicola TaxID=745819 RepID=A0ABS6K1B3_9BACI|nr:MULTISPECIES: phosphopantetheine-binding protein [Bacillaceae]MBU9723237.1 acyl carrier protein [Bacillus alkalicola]
MISLEILKERIIDILKLQIDPSSISLKTKLIMSDQLEIDSLDLVDLIVTLESEFDIDLTDLDNKNLYTVGDLLDTINSKLEDRSTGLYDDTKI